MCCLKRKSILCETWGIIQKSLQLFCETFSNAYCCFCKKYNEHYFGFNIILNLFCAAVWLYSANSTLFQGKKTNWKQ